VAAIDRIVADTAEAIRRSRSRRETGNRACRALPFSRRHRGVGAYSASVSHRGTTGAASYPRGLPTRLRHNGSLFGDAEGYSRLTGTSLRHSHRRTVGSQWCHPKPSAFARFAGGRSGAARQSNGRLRRCTAKERGGNTRAAASARRQQGRSMA
jgi:hypothetical protein